MVDSRRSTPPVAIVPFRRSHGREVARLHATALPHGFLSRLGPGFLARLYREIARADRSGVWVAQDSDQRVLGFIAGSADLPRCYRQVLGRAWLPLGLRLLPSLWRPGVLTRVLQTLAYPFRKGADSGDEDPEVARVRRQVKAELLSIAVSPAARGMGVGRRLVATLEEHLLAWGHRGPYRVVTDAADPRSNAFYGSLGFRLVGTFRHHEHTMSLYVKSIGGEDGMRAAGSAAP